MALARIHGRQPGGGDIQIYRWRQLLLHVDHHVLQLLQLLFVCVTNLECCRRREQKQTIAKPTNSLTEISKTSTVELRPTATPLLQSAFPSRRAKHPFVFLYQNSVDAATSLMWTDAFVPMGAVVTEIHCNADP